LEKNLSILSALLATFIWGTTFIAQDQGMDYIGPLTFNAARFFLGFLVLIVLAFVFELKAVKVFVENISEIGPNMAGVGISLFLASILQQYSLLYTDVANAAFFTIFYVLFVPVIAFFLYSKTTHWSIWPSVITCLIGGYFLSNFENAEFNSGDFLVLLGALFWALHIVFVSRVIRLFDFPFLISAMQCLIVSGFSAIFSLIFETSSLDGIRMEMPEILYAGLLSSGLAFLLQVYGQRFVPPAPIAVIFSLEGVFAVITAWLVLEQFLELKQIFGCSLILGGVLIAQLAPIHSKPKFLFDK